MADAETISLTKILKNSKILVNVEEALQDILVVSYVFESKLYQGVLLDSTKKILPCGITPPVIVLGQQGASNKADSEEDKFYSLSQRFTYFQEKPPNPGNNNQNNNSAAPFHLKRAIRPPARYKNSRMTVRLRPRQVLCSKCRSICNENSENVDHSRKRKCSEPITNSGSTDKKNVSSRDLSSRSPRPLFSENQRENQNKISSPPTESAKLCSPVLPKITRLQPSELTNALSESANKIKIVGNYWVRKTVDSRIDVNKKDKGVETRSEKKTCCLPVQNKVAVEEIDPPAKLRVARSPVLKVVNNKTVPEDDNATDGDVDTLNSPWDGDSGQEGDDSSDKMVLRKKRSVGSMEDLWDESVFEDGLKKARMEDEKKGRNARTTPVIKISFGSQGEGTVLKIPAKVQDYIPSESETEENAEKKQKTKDASAKAAKRALKKAKKEARRKMLCGSGTSPARSLSGASPRYGIGGTSPAYEALYHRRHKHKMKHKKKHRDDRKHGKEDGGIATLLLKSGDNIQDSNGNRCWDGNAPDDSYSAIKERCLKQKLSISLKRLNANAYMRCDFLGSNGSKSPGASSCSNSEMSDDHGETVPDFPPSNHPLMMRISTQTVGSCLTNDGRRMAVGDVVWGKIHGFPWWPGKVLSITVSRKDDGMSLAPQAHVAWYGSSTSSLMPCDQLSPFLETFKTRYNKKKRGPYKEAIRQATSEARKEDGPVLAITSSPREVNVVS